MEPPIQIESEGRKGPPRRSAAEELGLLPQRSDEGLDRLIQLLARLGDTPMAAFWVADQNRPFFASTQGFATRDVTHRAGLMEQALRQDDIFILPDASQDPRFASDPMVTGVPRLRFFASIVVRSRDHQRIGLLCLMDPEPRSREGSVRSALHDMRAIVEDRLRLRADVLHDPQTGALTRLHFDEIGDREWRRAMRALVPISVIIAELDQLHDFAGREGAAALDRSLRAAALAIQYSLHRPGDCVGRLDESRFAMLLPGTGEPGAVETAERVRNALEALNIPFAGAAGGLLTLSAGVNTVRSESLSRSDLVSSIELATAALRRSQAAGGNRWTLAGTAADSSRSS